MRTLGEHIRHRLHTLLANGAFLVIAGATLVLGIAANASLCSVLSSYARPERVASGVFTAMAVAHILSSIWFGIRMIS